MPHSTSDTDTQRPVTLKSIAQRLGVSVTTAHGLVTQGVERCRKCLERTRQ